MASGAFARNQENLVFSFFASVAQNFSAGSLSGMPVLKNQRYGR